ncbi:class I SAM-dependent methyltransferase [Streptomyces sp. WAC 04229]|uniref:class I SAM-dependent methyltransferase n=1 Tax=Streptomyces sp. WAC 04229 TaxID=2203206 RepID=UPI00163BC6D0|nr:class I SAM-dependent methyltransferase [Streptomyces sp. WAC 04229]
MFGYADSWETYWAETAAQGQSSLWDCEPAFASARDLPLFAPHLDPEQPLIDLGCGNGTQTRYLARHHGRVVGTDVSASAIRQARALDPDHIYLVLDLLDTSAVNALYDMLGDASIYMRTVLHQIRPEHRPAFAASLRTLLGANGVLAFVELASGAEDYLRQLTAEYGPPPALTRVLDTGVRPGSIHRDETLALLGEDEFTVLAESDTTVHTTYTLPTGRRAEVPAYFMALRRTRTRTAEGFGSR